MKLFIVLLFVLLCSCGKQITEPEIYTGVKATRIFHNPFCLVIGTNDLDKLIHFSSRQEAINTGYKPCKTCKP